jgi:hypothetical protein
MVIPILDYLIYGSTYTKREVSLAVLAFFGVFLVINEEKNDNPIYLEGSDKIFVLILLFFSITLGFSLSGVLFNSLKGLSIKMVLFKHIQLLD